MAVFFAIHFDSFEDSEAVENCGHGFNSFSYGDAAHTLVAASQVTKEISKMIALCHRPDDKKQLQNLLQQIENKSKNNPDLLIAFDG